MAEDYKDYKLKGTVHAPFSPILMEFEIPKSVFDKMAKSTDLVGRSSRGGGKSSKMIYNYGMHGGIPKSFLKKVHK